MRSRWLTDTLSAAPYTVLATLHVVSVETHCVSHTSQPVDLQGRGALDTLGGWVGVGTIHGKVSLPENHFYTKKRIDASPSYVSDKNTSLMNC